MITKLISSRGQSIATRLARLASSQASNTLRVENEADITNSEKRNQFHETFHQKKLERNAQVSQKLKNSMKDALLSLHNSNMISAPKPKKVVKNALYGKEQQQGLRKSSKNLKVIAVKAKKNLSRIQRAEEYFLKEADLENLTNEELLYSPMMRYSISIKDKLKDIQKKNYAKIQRFRRKEVMNQDIASAPQDKQYLTFKSFFDTIERAKEDLKKNQPQMYRYYLQSGIFANLDPTKFSPRDLEMPEYPGTVKGDRPEDDPEFYKLWIEQNASPIMKEIMLLFQRQAEYEAPKDQQGNLVELDHDEDIPSGNDTYDQVTLALDHKSYQDYQLPENADEKYEVFKAEVSHIKLGDKEILPFDVRALPISSLVIKTLFRRYEDFLKVSKFREEHYVKMKDNISVKEYLESPTVVQDSENPLLDLPKTYPTVYGYFELLPDKMQNEETIQDICRVFERWGMKWNLQEKLEFINQMCYICLDSEPALKWAVDEIHNNKRPKYTAKQMKRFILEDDRTFTEANNAFGNVLKVTPEDQIKIEAELDRCVGDFYRDPRGHEKVERFYNYDQLPFHYYDNEDGFYDEYIEQKRLRRGMTPLNRARKYYFH